MEIEPVTAMFLNNLRFHHRSVGNQFDDEGVIQTIRSGGKTNIEVGDNVLVHYHVGIGAPPNTGDTIDVGGYEVKLEERSEPSAYSQGNEDELGVEVRGEITRRLM